MSSLESLKRMQIISSDAYSIGEIIDIRYDPSNWCVTGIRTRTEKSAAKTISAGSGKSIVQIKPSDYVINDVMLMQETLSELNSVVSQDSDNFPALSFIEGKKVSSSEGVPLGTVHNVNVDLTMWSVPSISLKLEKSAYEPLGLKKGLLSKTVIVIRSEYIQMISEIVSLNQSIVDLRNEIIIE